MRYGAVTDLNAESHTEETAVPGRFDELRSRDLAMAALRLVILLGGVGFTSLLHDAGNQHLLFQAFGVYAAYGVVLYVVGWNPLRRGSDKAFYLAAATIDLAFAATVIYLTGAHSSPFFRALYLWAALLAYLFGLRIGAIGSLLAFAILLTFDFKDGTPSDPLPVLLQLGGLLMHGPLVGHLADRERSRAAALREALARVAEVNRQLVEEQAKLIQAEKLSSIGLLAAGVAHEINNPLSGVMGCVKALRDKAVPVERQEEYFEAVRDGLERIRGTVQSLLDYARQRPPHATVLDPAEVVVSCLRLLQPLERKKDLTVTNPIVAGAALVLADRTQVMQALVNILMNAIQAVRPGGRIGLELQLETDRIGLRVQDDGAGIAKDLLGRVCDPFFTTKAEGEGTGLGLALTLNIARAHGGDLVIESEEGKGTVVTLWLPRAQGGAHA